MNSRTHRFSGIRKLLAALVLSFICATVPDSAGAKDGRDFSAMYDITDVVAVDAAHVSLRLVVRIQNHSGAAVRGATVTLHQSLLPGQPLGTFTTLLNASDTEAVELTEGFLVSKLEFERWQTGQGPVLSAEYTSPNGTQVQRLIEVLRLPGLGERP